MRRMMQITPVLLVAALAACANDGGDAGSADAQMAAGDDRAMLATPTCEPSTRMPLSGRASPYDSVTVAVGEGQAKVCYGRPALKGRSMIGGEAVPYDTLWRTGANEPTTIHLNVPARIAGMEVEPGSYSLYTVPREGDSWTVIVNRSTSQWGHEASYTAEVRAQEVGRADVRAERIESTVEQFTLRAAEPGLVMEWQNSRVLIPVEPSE